MGMVAWLWYVDQRATGLEEQTTRVDRVATLVEPRLASLARLTASSALRWDPSAPAPGDAAQWSAELEAARTAEPSLIASVYLERVAPDDLAAVQARFAREVGKPLEPGGDGERLVLTRGGPTAMLGLDLTGLPVVVPVLDEAGDEVAVTTVEPSLFGFAESATAGPVVVLVDSATPVLPPPGYGVVGFSGTGLLRDVQSTGQAADGIRMTVGRTEPLLLGEVPAVGDQVSEPVVRTLTPFGPDQPVTLTVTPLAQGVPGAGPIALAAVGSLLSLLLGALLYTVARSRDRAEAAVVEATEDLKGSEQRMQALVRHAADLIVVIDRHGIVTFISPSVTDMFGYTPEDLLGRGALEMTADDETRRAFVEMGAVPRGGTTTREIVLHRDDGRAVHLRVTLTNMLDDPAVRGFVANMHDISDHKAYEALLARQAREDHLTGLPNRVRLDEVLETARDDSPEFAVLFLDLDGFKAVNDDLGHEAGDEVLRQLAARLRAGLRPSDTLVRLGGDEFVVVAPGCSHTGALDLADRIRTLLLEPFVAEGRKTVVGASIGISVGGPDSDDLGAVVRRADEDMYRSKLASRSG